MEHRGGEEHETDHRAPLRPYMPVATRPASIMPTM
jgi:hypothetical protein